MTFYERRAEWERREIEQALRRARGVVTAAAQSLGIGRKYLYRKCQKLGMPIGRARGSWSIQGL